MFDHAQEVVVVGVGVGPLLHDRGNGCGMGSVCVDTAAHSYQLVSSCAHCGAIRGTNLGVERGDFVADDAVFVADRGQVVHGGAQLDGGAGVEKSSNRSPVVSGRAMSKESPRRAYSV